MLKKCLRLHIIHVLMLLFLNCKAVATKMSCLNKTNSPCWFKFDWICILCILICRCNPAFQKLNINQYLYIIFENVKNVLCGFCCILIKKNITSCFTVCLVSLVFLNQIIKAFFLSSPECAGTIQIVMPRVHSLLLWTQNPSLTLISS